MGVDLLLVGKMSNTQTRTCALLLMNQKTSPMKGTAKCICSGKRMGRNTLMVLWLHKKTATNHACFSVTISATNVHRAIMRRPVSRRELLSAGTASRQWQYRYTDSHGKLFPSLAIRPMPHNGFVGLNKQSCPFSLVLACVVPA